MGGRTAYGCVAIASVRDLPRQAASAKGRSGHRERALNEAGPRRGGRKSGGSQEEGTTGGVLLRKDHLWRAIVPIGSEVDML